MEWAKTAKKDNYEFSPTRTTRSAQVSYLKKWMNIHNECLPYQVPLELPGDPSQTINITRFNFTAQLVSLVKDFDCFGSIDNLDVKTGDVFGQYKVSNNKLLKANSGLLYRQAYKNMVKDPNKDFLMPILFACDETKIG